LCSWLFIGVWTHVDSKLTTLVADTTAANANFNQLILSELDSGDQVRVERAKKMLRKSTETGLAAAAIWQEAAK